MPTAGQSVLMADGRRGILASGKAAVFDATGNCTECCPGACACCDVPGGVWGYGGPFVTYRNELSGVLTLKLQDGTDQVHPFNYDDTIAVPQDAPTCSGSVFSNRDHVGQDPVVSTIMVYRHKELSDSGYPIPASPPSIRVASNGAPAGRILSVQLDERVLGFINGAPPPGSSSLNLNMSVEPSTGVWYLAAGSNADQDDFTSLTGPTSVVIDAGGLFVRSLEFSNARWLHQILGQQTEFWQRITMQINRYKLTMADGFCCCPGADCNTGPLGLQGGGGPPPSLPAGSTPISILEAL